MAGQELWVVGSDEIRAGKSAEKLLEKNGYPPNTSFELIKVVTKFINTNVIQILIVLLGWRCTRYVVLFRFITTFCLGLEGKRR